MKWNNRSRWLILGMLAVALTGAAYTQQQPNEPKAQASQTNPAATGPVVQPGPTGLVPVARIELAPNITVIRPVDPVHSVPALLSQHLAQAGAIAGKAGVPAVVPRQIVYILPAAEAERQRRVLVEAEVCLRHGFLEHLLTRTAAQKEHESILRADIDAQHLHMALIAIGAQPGKPVQFVDDKGEEAFRPPSGERIKVTLQYQQGGKTVTVPAQRWIRDSKTRKELVADWVFAGSRFYPNPSGNGPPYYGANEGRVICVSNFVNALLDLPIQSSDKTDLLQFEANTELIPPKDTKVTVIHERVPEQK